MLVANLSALRWGANWDPSNMILKLRRWIGQSLIYLGTSLKVIVLILIIKQKYQFVGLLVLFSQQFNAF
jgi:hypothetical protein